MVFAEQINYWANVTTVIAFLFAGYQFFQWRRQQRHSLELESILNMEDRFELLIISNVRVVASLRKAEKIARESLDKTREEKSEIDLWLKNEFFESVKSDQRIASESAVNYSLAYFRVRRLGFDVASTDELNCEWVVKKFNALISGDLSDEEVAKQISLIKKKAGERFAILRKI